MALGWQALEAKKARKPLEQGGALERVAARIEQVMGLTPKFTGKTTVAKRRRVFPVQRLVRHVLQAEYQPHAQRMPTLLMRGVEPIIY